MKVDAYSAQGEARSKRVTLPESPFDGVVNEDALHQVVTAILAHGRQGTASTKTWGTVRGGSRKPWRQKGTGRARHGSTRSPIWRGGVVTFGPQPRSYDVKIPRTLKRLALRSALNARAAEGDLAVVEPLELEAPRTRAIAELLRGVEAQRRKVLILTDGHKPLVHRSCRNIPNVAVRPWGEASAYDVLWSELVLVESSAIEREAAGTGEDA
ncbi:MAG: 50S ribosomal protein L4 [Gemmatimonadota bacterium]